MSATLFHALTDEANPARHPVLTALLYVYCPKAAELWLAGGGPDIPFDPVWQALADLSTGATLAEKLDEYGLSAFRPDVRAFIERVDAYRRIHPKARAPEKTDLFDGFSVSKERLFANRDALRKHMGGSGKGLLLYVHAWVYLAGDWKDGMKFPSMPRISPERVSIMLSGTRRPVYLPVWKWSLEQSGHTRTALSWLMRGDPAYAHQLAAALLSVAQRAGEKPWKTAPELWALDADTGRASTLRSRMPETVPLSDVILGIGTVASASPGVPVGALADPARCMQCGFRRHCWAGTPHNYLTGDSHMSEFSFSFLLQKT